MSQIPSLTAEELRAELAGPNPPSLIDVREPHELDISRLDGIINIPMAEVAGRIGEFAKEAPLVLICRSGSRSGRVTQYLAAQGYSNVRNFDGGMNSWAREIDPDMATY
jgi:adenylyltransferase/sulfurtransferase